MPTIIPHSSGKTVSSIKPTEIPSVKYCSITHDEAILANYLEYDGEDESDYDSDYDDLEYLSEGREVYNNGRLYPICIGDKIKFQVGNVLEDRYQISHRLGRGGYSTVWLAQDLRLNEAVALKIMVPGDTGDKEYNMQKVVAQDVQDSSHVLLCKLEDTFLLKGLKGNHRVLVLPLAGPDLGTLGIDRPLLQRMSAAKQALQAIESFHKAGLVHSDISLGNLLCGIKTDCKGKFKSLSTTYSELGFPKRIRYETEWNENGKISKKLLELVKPLEIPTAWLSDKVYLTDFGTTFRAGTKVENKLQGVPSFCAPERFHGQWPSPASDMWSFGLIFFYLYTGKVPFQGIMSHTAGDILSAMVNRLGPLPEKWKGLYTTGTQPDASWYDPENNSLPVPDRTLEKIIHDRQRPGSDEAERLLESKTEKHALAVFKKVFSYLPERRPTASQLLQDPDFKKLLEMCGVQGGAAGH
ncbi:hypothetical protein VMCG_05719 [Cytospora schulzeri]|uniref:Protein kinase domain-containing protein n=1 Tax=Cytospora schulzeri TaxID=448051 RepID=A0A423WIE5_9PEZI|nr:hypothetical protein VMCG_05719 [Valsa malicola]